MALDLRGNMGGNTTECQRLASMFLDGEPLWIRGVEKIIADQSERMPVPYQLPVAVTIDADMWSASEMFAFGLRQHRRAVIVGQRSGGHVGIGRYARLPGGGFLIVTTAQISGPSGEIYDGVGIMPDLATPGEAAVDVAAEHLRVQVAAIARPQLLSESPRSSSNWS